MNFFFTMNPNLIIFLWGQEGVWGEVAGEGGGLVQVSSLK